MCATYQRLYTRSFDDFILLLKDTDSTDSTLLETPNLLGTKLLSVDRTASHAGKSMEQLISGVGMSNIQCSTLAEGVAQAEACSR